MAALPVKITADLQVVVAPNAPPLTPSQVLELGKRFIERGAEAVAREAVGLPPRGGRMERRGKLILTLAGLRPLLAAALTAPRTA